MINSKVLTFLSSKLIWKLGSNNGYERIAEFKDVISTGSHSSYVKMSVNVCFRLFFVDFIEIKINLIFYSDVAYGLILKKAFLLINLNHQ